MLKRFTVLLAAALSFIMLFGGISPALADTTENTLGITTFYSTPEQQKQGVTVYQDILNYGVAVPFQLPPDFVIPNSKKAFEKKVAPQLIDALGDGSVTKAWFDFQSAKTATSGNQLFRIDAPVGEKLYSVVAGKPAQQCPLEIEDTQISFFTDATKAITKAQDLDHQGYLIYVSPDKNLREKVIDDLYDQYKAEKKNKACFLVNGATQKVTVDFQEIFTLLPPGLQQPAQDQPFVFFPKLGNKLYIVNARQTA